MNCGICVLAGGRSRRMGQDKARLRLGSRTLLGHIRVEATEIAQREGADSRITVGRGLADVDDIILGAVAFLAETDEQVIRGVADRRHRGGRRKRYGREGKQRR